jgi:glycosyltransferase involved in cell wall biosynthesis
MANVLLLTYMFPPAGGIGTPRALAYTQYLPRPGCRLSVLAPTNPALRDRDPDLDRLIPADVVVHRAWNPEVPMSMRDRIWRRGTLHNGPVASTRASAARWMARPFRWMAHHLLFPDPQVLWAPSAFHKACKVIERDAIDTIIVNMPPYSLLKVALALKRQFPHLKLITDFRDEWLGYYLSQIDHPTEEKVRRAWELEAEAVHVSTYVSTVTDTWVQRLRSRYPGEPASKFVCTPNGYDPGMFRDFKPRRRTDGKIIVTYFGTVHGNRVYSPENYLKAIEGLPPAIRNQFETRFIGRIVGDAQSSLTQTKATVRLLGFMPKEQGIRHLQESDFLLLIATDPSSHAGKLFDYFACSKPILALSPPGGEIDRLLRLTRTGWCADPWDPAAIQHMILTACRQLRQGPAAMDRDMDAIRKYSWPCILDRFTSAVEISPAVLSSSGNLMPEIPMSVGA